MAHPQFSIPRHWWGKIIGAAIGLFKGGLVGALFGAFLGHMVDRFLVGIVSVGSTQKAFFDSLFSALGHLAKADGVVTATEIRMVEDLMRRMQISGEDRQRAIKLFNQGKQQDFDLDAGMKPFLKFSGARPDLRQMFIQILIEAAFSSGTVTTAEQQILLRIAGMLRIPGAVFSAMMQARGGAGPAGGGGQQGAIRTSHSIEQDYAELGLTSKASESEIKKAYRKLVSQYHPDKLVSRGLPEEMMEMAKNRVRDINTAYDRIKQDRGIK